MSERRAALDTKGEEGRARASFRKLVCVGGTGSRSQSTNGLAPGPPSASTAHFHGSLCKRPPGGEGRLEMSPKRGFRLVPSICRMGGLWMAK